MKISVVIPTYNEQEHIEATLLALLKSDYPDFEIIVVDDSTDLTPDIIRSIDSDLIKLLRPAINEGRSGARNIGIKESSGEVILILNADVMPEKTFLNSIKKYYDEGYDSVSVMNHVLNQDTGFSCLLEARKRLRLRKGVYKDWAAKQNGVVWTEGFSVRKAAAMKTDLFPVGGERKIVAGEDARFAAQLVSSGCHGKFAFEISVGHIVPQTLSEFWQVRVGRGRGVPQVKYYLDKWSLGKILARNLVRGLQRALKLFLVVPYLLESIQLTRAYAAENFFTHIAGIYIALITESLAFTYGENHELFEIFRSEKQLS